MEPTFKFSVRCRILKRLGPGPNHMQCGTSHANAHALQSAEDTWVCLTRGYFGRGGRIAD